MPFQQGIAVTCRKGYIPKVKKEEQENRESKKYQYIAPFYVIKKGITADGSIAGLFGERHPNLQCMAYGHSVTALRMNPIQSVSYTEVNLHTFFSGFTEK
jgi:hypothetical protein